MSESKWIRCDERLPEFGERVLVLSKFGYVYESHLEHYLSGVDLFAPDGMKPVKDVKYWMEMPEIPGSEAFRKREPMNNGDYIRSLSDEDLADFICAIYSGNDYSSIRIDGNWVERDEMEEWLRTPKEEET